MDFFSFLLILANMCFCAFSLKQEKVDRHDKMRSSYKIFDSEVHRLKVSMSYFWI